MSRKSPKSKRSKSRPKRRSNPKPARKRVSHSKKRSRANQAKGNSRKHVRRRRRRRNAITDPRVAGGLGIMRREGASASEAARREGMKLKTFRKGAGRFLCRSGPGKPWKARSEDQLSFSMSVLTRKGRVDVVVRSSRERKLLHEHESAVRMFRAAEDGSEEELKKFKGKTVGGHELVTDIKQLIELEEADELDFESLYTPVGGRS